MARTVSTKDVYKRQVYRQFEDVGEFIDEIKSLGERRPRDGKQPELFR